MTSIGEKCNDLKHSYDACFNAWFSEKFLIGDTNDSACAPLFKVYQQCVKVFVITFVRIRNNFFFSFAIICRKHCEKRESSLNKLMKFSFNQKKDRKRKKRKNVNDHRRLQRLSAVSRTRKGRAVEIIFLRQ